MWMVHPKLPPYCHNEPMLLQDVFFLALMRPFRHGTLVCASQMLYYRSFVSTCWTSLGVDYPAMISCRVSSFAPVAVFSVVQFNPDKNEPFLSTYTFDAIWASDRCGTCFWMSRRRSARVAYCSAGCAASRAISSSVCSVDQFWVVILKSDFIIDYIISFLYKILHFVLYL